MPDSRPLPPTPLERAKTLQDIMVWKVGGDHDLADGALYEALRKSLMRDPAVPDMLIPKIVRRHRDLDHLWSYAKAYDGSWEPRRRHVRDEFGPLLDHLEAEALGAPADAQVMAALATLDPDAVTSAWARALERRSSDPEGAITAARTLLETVLKHVATDVGASFDDADDLPKLYRAVSTALNLAPSQHTEQVFKQVLGGCVTVVEGIGAVRNKIGDAHGQGPRPVRPTPRHAALVVNLAGAMATFVVETWASRKPGG